MRKRAFVAFDHATPMVRSLEGILIIAAVVFLSALFGIFTRPVGLLASFWPANPILLGLLIRKPGLATPGGWAAACLAFLAADAITGANTWTMLWLTGANLAGVTAGFLLFRQLPRDDQRLRRPLSIIYMFGICVIATICSAAVGSGVTEVLYSRKFLTGFAFWFTGDLVNLIIVLPVALTVPSLRKLHSAVGSVFQHKGFVLKDWLPFLAFVISLCGSALIGGAGAFAYPVPALLWCAVRYDLFYVACCSLLYCAVQTIIVSSGLYPSYVMGDALNSIMSVRLAIVLIALGPLSVASINLARNELIAKLEHALRYDYLTNSLSRREFIGKATATLSRTAGSRSVTAVLLLDIDHFKSINDRFGHSAGDQVLVAFVSRISDMLGEHDLLGRIGGEEFGVILASTTVDRATRMAEHIRNAVEDLRISHPDADGLSITVSGGLAFAHREGPRALDILLSRADTLLYEAKNSGRNRIVSSNA